MSMGIGINSSSPDSGEIRGTQEAVACGIWFTSTGRVIPKTVKFEDDNGVYHMLQHIRVTHQEEQNYCGIPTITFKCDTIYRDRQVEFHLIFYTEQRKWVILWKNRHRKRDGRQDR